MWECISERKTIEVRLTIQEFKKINSLTSNSKLLIMGALLELLERSASVDKKGAFENGAGGKTADTSVFKKYGNKVRRVGGSRSHVKDGLRMVEGREERCCEERF